MGLPKFLYEAAIHPLEMLQALPVPELSLPDAVSRGDLVFFFVQLSFRLYTILYRSMRSGSLRACDAPCASDGASTISLLLATVVWGGIYFVRSFGRADEPHLDSAIPPVCLLLAHAASLAYHAVPAYRALAPAGRGDGDRGRRLVLWSVLLGVDMVLDSPLPGPDDDRRLCRSPGASRRESTRSSSGRRPASGSWISPRRRCCTWSATGSAPATATW